LQDKYDPNDCLTRADSNFNRPKEILNMLNCIEAIGIGDTREIFIVDVDW